jgi:hypothetical protein
LQEEVKITFKEINKTNLSAYAPLFAPLLGAIDLKPDGLVFAKPVTVSFKITYTSPGKKLPLFRFDDRSFSDTGILATVSEDGSSVVAEIDRFSTYAVLDRWGEMKEVCAMSGREPNGPVEDMEIMIRVIEDVGEVAIGERIGSGDCCILAGGKYTLKKDGKVVAHKSIGITTDPEEPYCRHNAQLSCSFVDSRGGGKIL